MKKYVWGLLGVLMCCGGFYISTFPGDLVITVMGWRFHAPLWLGLIGILFISFVVFLIFLSVRFLFLLPSRISAHFATRRMKKGLTVLTQFMTGYYAQDHTNMVSKCGELECSFPSPVVGLWCRAMMIKKQPNPSKAELHSLYKTLKNTEGGKFLGLYGLIELADKDRDTIAFRKLLEEAFTACPSSEWAKYQLVTFYLEEGVWEKAKKYIDILDPRSSFEKERKSRAKAQLWLLKAHEEGRPSSEKKEFLMEAHEACPTYAPGAIAFAEELVDKGKRAKALSVLEEAWKSHPRREIGEAYLAQALGNDPVAAFEMARTLISWAPEDNTARFLVINAALRAQLWGEAEKYLKEVDSVHAEPSYYELYARWYEESCHDLEKARLWRKKGLENLDKSIGKK